MKRPATRLTFGRTLFTLLFFFMTLTTAMGQDFFDDDARFWLYVKMDKKAASRRNAELNVQNRFNDNITSHNQINLNSELPYKMNKHAKLQCGPHLKYVVS